MTQNNLFTPTAEYVEEMNTQTEDAIERAYKHAPDEWRKYALQCVEAVAKRNEEFTVNEVRSLIKAGIYKTHDNRALGGVMKTAQRLGIIEPTGNTIPSVVGHRTPIQIWRSRIFNKTGNYVPESIVVTEKPVVTSKPKYEYQYDPVRNCMVEVLVRQ